MPLFDMMIQLTNFHRVTINKNVMIRKEVYGNIQLKVNTDFMLFQKRSFEATFIKKDRVIKINQCQWTTAPLRQNVYFINKLAHSRTNKMNYVCTEDSVQPGYQPSHTRFFTHIQLI